MYYSITAKKDATIYERSESLNSGLDEILEIQKVVSASNTTDTLNSRILIKFPLWFNNKCNILSLPVYCTSKRFGL